MVISITQSTNDRYWMYEGTAQELINSLDTFKVPCEDIMASGYNVTNSKYFALVRRSRV